MNTYTHSGRTKSREAVAPVARFELALAVCAIVALFAGAWLSGSLTLSAGDAPLQTTSIRVSQGDTLWSIARSHPCAGMSTAETVKVLARLNEVENGHLIAGETIAVPSSSHAGETLALR